NAGRPGRLGVPRYRERNTERRMEQVESRLRDRYPGFGESPKDSGRSSGARQKEGNGRRQRRRRSGSEEGGGGTSQARYHPQDSSQRRRQTLHLHPQDLRRERGRRRRSPDYRHQRDRKSVV